MVLDLGAIVKFGRGIGGAAAIMGMGCIAAAGWPAATANAAPAGCSYYQHSVNVEYFDSCPSQQISHLMMATSANQLVSGVHDAVKNQLGPDANGGMGGPLGFAPTAAERRYPEGSWLSYVQEGRAADFSAVPVQRMWNVWIDANVSHTDRDDPIFGHDGYLATSSIGIDRRFGDRLALGVFANVEGSDYSLSFSDGSLESFGGGVGVYGGFSITPRLILDALAMWKAFDNDIDGFGGSSASYDSDRWVLAANLTGYYDFGAWRVSPQAGVIWSREDQDGYTLEPIGIPVSDDEKSHLVLKAGSQLEYTYFGADGRSFSPFASAFVEWNDFDYSPDGPALLRDDLDGFDLRLGLGFNARIAENVLLTVKSDFTGFLRDDYFVATGGGQLSVQF